MRRGCRCRDCPATRRPPAGSGPARRWGVGAHVPVRDGKNPTGPVVTIDADAWTALLERPSPASSGVGASNLVTERRKWSRLVSCPTERRPGRRDGS
ncbi:DUF397 domain-containing protein [Streptomyces hydrogenans]|uniref:DUF397 domain-containing protein n=1 Tax=Streptomyces hydrogenans TaxID=1873719 RepID=UPI00343B6920